LEGEVFSREERPDMEPTPSIAPSPASSSCDDGESCRCEDVPLALAPSPDGLLLLVRATRSGAAVPATLLMPLVAAAAAAPGTLASALAGGRLGAPPPPAMLAGRFGNASGGAPFSSGRLVPALLLATLASGGADSAAALPLPFSACSCSSRCWSCSSCGIPVEPGSAKWPARPLCPACTADERPPSEMTEWLLPGE
jgi:hypothetical protein